MATTEAETRCATSSKCCSRSAMPKLSSNASFRASGGAAARADRLDESPRLLHENNNPENPNRATVEPRAPRRMRTLMHSPGKRKNNPSPGEGIGNALPTLTCRPDSVPAESGFTRHKKNLTPAARKHGGASGSTVATVDCWEKQPIDAFATREIARRLECASVPRCLRGCFLFGLQADRWSS